MDEPGQQIAHVFIVSVGGIETAHHTDDGGNLLDQPSEQTPYETVAENNNNENIKGIHLFIRFWQCPG
jgi:hypothetical protein